VAKLSKPLRRTKISAALVAFVLPAACLVPAAMASEGPPPPPRHGHGHGHGPKVALHGATAGHVHGMVPAVQSGGEASGGTTTVGSGTHVDLGQTSFSSTENLAYHEGPVLHSNTTYAIYWVPPGSTVSAKYTSLINGFLTNVALASGYSSTVFATDTQ